MQSKDRRCECLAKVLPPAKYKILINQRFLNDIMKNLKLTVEQAMDALSIPQSQRSIYAGLVGKHIQ